MNLGATIERLEGEGFTTEQIVKILKCIVAAEPVAVRSSGAERTARWREKKMIERHSDVTSVTCDAKEIPPTPPKENNNLSVVSPPIVPPQELDGFDAFWATYPKRDGNADRKGAVKAFAPAAKRAGDHSLITRAAARYAAHCREKGKLGTEFVKQARSWLNGDLWREWLPQEPTKAAVTRVMVREGSPAWDAWKRTGRRFNAMDLKDDNGHVIGRGWYFPSEYPIEEKAA